MGNRPRRNGRWWLAAVVLCSCVGCDQATKEIATRTLRNAPPRSFLADTVRLQYALNPGGFLSLGANLPERTRQVVFVGLGGVMMAAVATFLVRRPDASLGVFVAASLILAGGIGNLIDRVVNRGLVTDFLNLGIGPVRTGVFNVADMVLMAGAILGWAVWSESPASEKPAASAPPIFPRVE